MPRGGPPTNTYTLPAVYLAVPGTTILAVQHNSPFEDIAATLNIAWPMNIGGTGGTSAITSWDSINSLGTAIPTASSLDLDAATGANLHLTGAVTVTSVSLTSGRVRQGIIADSAFLITASALLVVNGYTSGNIQVPAGAVMTFVGGAVGVVYVAFTDSASASFLGYTTTATAAGTTTLTAASTYQQYFTGATTQTVTLPVTATLNLGFSFRIVNNSTGVVTVNSSGGNAVVAMQPGTQAIVTCILTSGTTAASWSITYIPIASNANSTTLTLTSNDTGAAAAPIIDLYRDSASPAVNDILGQIIWNGEDSAGNKQEYASIEATIVDPTSTSEDGTLDIYTVVAGARTRNAYFSNGLYLPATANSFNIGTYSTVGATDGKASTSTVGIISSSRSNSGARVHYEIANPNGITGTIGSTGNDMALGSPLGAINLLQGQLTFPATQNASSNANTLDDYEEFTWAPAATFATVGDLSIAYSSQVGSGVKIGSFVKLDLNIITSTFTHTTASGNLRVTTLPFTTKTLSGYIASGAGFIRNYTKANFTMVSARIDSAATFVVFTASGSGQVPTNLSTGDTPTGGTLTLVFTVPYEAA